MKLYRIISVLFFSLLVMTVVSCQNDVSVIFPEERDMDEVSITFTTEFAHDREGFLYPGETVTINSRSDVIKRVLENTKTIVWTFIKVSNGDNLIDTETTYGGVTSVTKVFNNEGIYKVRADLFNSEDYESLGVGAPLLGTDERQIVVEAIDFKIETSVIDEKVMQFRPKILNPEIGLVYTGLRIYFGDNTVEVFEDRIPDSITHQYSIEGIYNLNAELIYKSENSEAIIATSDTSFRVKGDLYIVAPSGSLLTETIYTFQAHQVKPLPAASAYGWDFGDGTVAKIPYTNEVSHMFVKPGSYVVSVDVLDSEVMGENKLASTYLPVEVVVSENILDKLHRMTKFDLDFSLQHDYTDLTTGFFIWGWDSHGTLVWDGTHFSMEWSQDRHSENLMGRVSEDGTFIENLMIRHEFVDNDRAQTLQWYELVIHDLPFLLDEVPDEIIAHKRGEELNDFVTYFNTYKTEGYQWTKDAELTITLTKE